MHAATTAMEYWKRNYTTQNSLKSTISKQNKTKQNKKKEKTQKEETQSISLITNIRVSSSAVVDLRRLEKKGERT